jgi:hypothetical protein
MLVYDPAQRISAKQACSILTLGVAAPDLHAGVLMAMKFYIEG